MTIMINKGKLDSKVALITGGASGIGAAMARLFVREGASIIIGDVNESAGRLLVEELNNFSQREVAIFKYADVSRLDNLYALVAQAEASFDKLDILCNNAGIGVLGNSVAIEESQWQRVINVDLNSVFYGCKAGIPALRRAGGGVIVNTASISGIAADYGMGAYNAAKAGVINYTKTVAIDHATENIRCNALCPGVVLTSMTHDIMSNDAVAQAWCRAVPMRRPGRPSEIAEAALFLVSDAASYITGSTMIVDGGLTATNGQPNFSDLLKL